MNSTKNRAFGERIAHLRKMKERTQAEMAKDLNLTRNTISKWEAGIQDIKSQEIIALSQYFNVSCDELLTGNKPEHAELANNLGLTTEAIETLQRFKRCADGKLTEEEKKKFKKFCFPYKNDLYEALPSALVELEKEKANCKREELMPDIEIEINRAKSYLHMVQNITADYQPIFAEYERVVNVVNYILKQAQCENALSNLGKFLEGGHDEYFLGLGGYSVFEHGEEEPFHTKENFSSNYLATFEEYLKEWKKRNCLKRPDKWDDSME